MNDINFLLNDRVRERKDERDETCVAESAVAGDGSWAPPPTRTDRCLNQRADFRDEKRRRNLFFSFFDAAIGSLGDFWNSFEDLFTRYYILPLTREKTCNTYLNFFYYMSKKSWPILHWKLQFKMGQELGTWQWGNNLSSKLGF